MNQLEQGPQQEGSPIEAGKIFVRSRQEKLQLALATTIDTRDLPALEEALKEAAQGESVAGGDNA